MSETIFGFLLEKELQIRRGHFTLDGAAAYTANYSICFKQGI
jgi:hypothetical protein